MPEVPEDVVHDEFATPAGAVAYRPVTIIDASEPKRLDIKVQVPIEDMAKVSESAAAPAAAPASAPPTFAAALRRSRPRRRRSGRRSIRGCSS